MSFREKAQSIWHIQRVKRLVRDHLGGSQCIISVRETMCTDPGCEGPATEIRIITLACQEIRAVVHKQASEITFADVTTIV